LHRFPVKTEETPRKSLGMLINQEQGEVDVAQKYNISRVVQ